MEKSLKQIKIQLQHLNQYATWKLQPETNRAIIKFSGLKNTRVFIEGIDQLGLFKDVVNRLKNSLIFQSGDDTLSVRSQESNSVKDSLDTLKDLSANFLQALTQTLPAEDVNSINIKLPEISDFDELSKVSREIHIALSQPILNDEVNGQAKIVSVENGSIWFNIFIGASALSAVASIAWSAAVVFKKMQEGKIAEQHFRTLKIQNDMIEALQVAQKKELDLLTQAEAEYIKTNTFPNSGPEQIERLKTSITIFADLIQKGGEIHPALAAPENVTNLFPDLKNLIGIESKTKRIANE